MSHTVGAGRVVADILAFWALLTAIGLPLTLACLPRARRDLALLAAPVSAIAGLSSLSHLTFFTLQQPYRPLATYGTFVLASLALLIARRRPPSRMGHGRAIGRDVLRGWPFLAVPVLFVLGFGTLFWSNGLLLFSAAEDELGYIDVARQIMGHLNARDALDVPWPRPDHLLTDFTGHILAYVPSSRLGAFVLLADVSRLFKLPLELAFPLLMGVLLAVGVAAVGIVRLHLKGRGFPLIPAQAALAASFLLVMLHFQGSLSSVASLGFRTGGLAVVLWAVALRRGWRPLLLAVVLAAGWLPVYVESFGLGLLVPLLAAAGVAEYVGRGRARRDRHRPLARLSMVLASICAIHPDLAAAAFTQYRDRAGYLALDALWRDPLAALSRAKTYMDLTLLPVIGAYSLYDRSTANLLLGRAVLPYMLGALLILAILSGVGFATRLRSRPTASAWAALALALPAMSVLAGLGQSTVASTRGAQWFMPVGLLGVSLLAFGGARRGRPASRGLQALPTAAAVLTWILFVGSNLNSVVRTDLHVNGHTRETELSIRYLDTSRPPWTTLRAALATPDDRPILMSGFRDTPLSHTIGEGLREIPVLLGESITSYWIGIDPMRMGYLAFVQGNTAFWGRGKVAAAKLADDPIAQDRWPETYARLLAETARAIVPNGAAYPAEWGRRGTLLGTRSTRFVNLCDVVDRTGPALELASGQVTAGEDRDGPYWTADEALTVTPLGGGPDHGTFSIVYDGDQPSVTVGGTTPKFSLTAQPQSAKMVWSAEMDVPPEEAVVVAAGATTKLRSVDLYR